MASIERVILVYTMGVDVSAACVLSLGQICHDPNFNLLIKKPFKVSDF